MSLATSTPLSTPGGTPTGTMFLEFTSFQTTTPSRSEVPSPQVGVMNTLERVDLTPKGVARHFLQLRFLLNQHVSQEREKGVGIRLDYDEPEPSLSPGPPPLPFTGSRPNTSHFEAGPSVTSQPFNPTPHAYGRPSPVVFPLLTSQPAVTGTLLGHETTFEQLWQSPASSVLPPVATTWEQALAVWPLARSAADVR
ncbi:hypothetical protein HanRHA438_Chr03g0111831 [Helianthus annuus]|nr:hypothetical protein HanRHA438_Chr03g0111831 [Helianthus annuus]